MLLNCRGQIAAWIKRKGTHSARRRVRVRRGTPGRPCGAEISQLEILESRELLSATFAVHVHGNAIRLTEQDASNSTGADVSVSYTSSQVALTGNNGTTFKV